MENQVRVITLNCHKRIAEVIYTSVCSMYFKCQTLNGTFFATLFKRIGVIVETCLLISETASVVSMVYEKLMLCSIVPLLSGLKPGHALDSSVATSLGSMLVVYIPWPVLHKRSRVFRVKQQGASADM